MFDWVLLLTLIRPSYAVDIFYTQAFECANQSTVINESFSSIYNDGYKSQYGSLMVVDFWIYCRAAFSCAKASVISNRYIACYATNSCSKLETHDAIRGYTKADGVNAMVYAMISASESSIDCYGEQSCAYSVIKGPNTIYGYGAYSLLNASVDSTINGTSTGSLTINLYGYYSGFGANIICRTGDICTIYCGSNGCINLHINCNNNCIIDKQSNDISWNGIQYILLYDSIKIATQNDAECSVQIDTMNFDDDAERWRGADIIGNTNNKGPICCRGSASCTRIYNIDNTASTEQGVICSGHSSCAQSSIHTSGPVFCGALNACYSSRIVTIGSVYCYGSNSCLSAHITTSSCIYCSAFHSCADTVISSNNTDFNLYLLGYESGSKSSVSCHTSNQCSIFCYGYKACSNLDLVCAGNCTVYCDEDSLCPNGWTAPSQSPTTERPIMAPSQSPSQLPSMMHSSTQSVYTSALTTVVYKSMNETMIRNESNPTDGVVIYWMDKNKHQDIEYIFIIISIVLSIILLSIVILIGCLCLMTKRKKKEVFRKQMKRMQSHSQDKKENSLGEADIDDDGHEGSEGVCNAQNETVDDAIQRIVYNMNISDDKEVVGDDETLGADMQN